jgi:DNA-binding transcriptional LysR family regulator
LTDLLNLPGITIEQISEDDHQYSVKVGRRRGDRQCCPHCGCLSLRPNGSREVRTGAGAHAITVRPKFSVNTADAVIEAAIAGLGLAQVLSYQPARAIRSGQLKSILVDHAPPPMPVQLVYRSQRIQPLKHRAFLDFVTPRLKSALDDIATLLSGPP